jgi:hypothetical protein
VTPGIAAVMVAMTLSAAPAERGSLLDDRVKYSIVVYWLERPPAAAEAAAVLKDANVRVESGKPAIPSVDVLKPGVRGLKPDELDLAKRSTGATVFNVDAPAARRFEVLERVIRAADSAARKWNGLILDPGTGELHSPDAWKERRIDQWEGGVPSPFGHTISHIYPKDDGTYRLVTLGMQKLGLPELAVDALPMTLNDDMQQLVDYTAFELIRHPVLPPDGVLTVDVDGHPAHVKLVTGKNDEGEQPGRVLAFAFEGKGSLAERESALLLSVFGSHSPQERLASKDDAELNAARDRARAKLPDVKRRYPKLVQSAASLIVKAPFVVDGQTKWRWVEVSAWDGDKIAGTLAIPSTDAHEAKRGTAVTVNPKDVFDYVILFPDGTHEGGETDALLQRRAHYRAQCIGVQSIE